MTPGAFLVPDSDDMPDTDELADFDFSILGGSAWSMRPTIDRAPTREED